MRQVDPAAPTSPLEQDIPSASETMLLAERAREGDRDALGVLVGRHGDWLRRVIRIKLCAHRRLSARFDSCDVAQDVLVVVSRKIGGFQPENAASFRAWLARIATHVVGDQLKHEYAGIRDPRLEAPAPAPRPSQRTTHLGDDIADSEADPGRRAWKEELREILDSAVAELPEHYQEVVLLRDYFKAGWEEIRQRLGKETQGAAKQLYFRAWILIKKVAAPRLVARGDLEGASAELRPGP